MKRTRIRQLAPSEPDPAGEPRRYENADGYVRLRWKVAPGEYLERYERTEAGTLTRTRPPKPQKRIDVARAARLYAEGKTLPEVAAIVGCDHGALSRALRRHGVQARPPNSYHHPEPDTGEVVRLYTEGLGLRDVARKLATSTEKVRRVLLQEGVTVRQRRRADRQLSVYEAEFRRARPLVRARSGGRCEAQASPACSGQATHVHHRKLRSQGGTNDLGNLLDTCLWCHGAIHGRVAASLERGLLVASWADPADVAVVPGTL